MRRLSMAYLWRRRAYVYRGLVVSVVLCLVGAALVWSLGNGQKSATVVFPSATSLYSGDEVRILGVEVGSVDEVTPAPDGVRVRLHYDAEYQVPVGAKAVIVSPALVAARYVELTPAYTGGKALADDAVIPQQRTSVPVEFDRIKKELSKLASALGPSGANKSGALSRLLDTGATYKGQGKAFNETVEQVSQAIDTIAAGRTDLFGTVRNLAVFVNAMKAIDGQIVDFTTRLDSVSATLNNNRDTLSAAVEKLDTAAADVTKFLANNRTKLKSGTKKLSEILGVVETQRDDLAQALHVAPTVLANAYNIYDPLSGSFTGSLALPNFQNPAQFVCSGIGAAAQVTPARAGELCQQTLGPVLKLLRMTYPPVGVNPIVRPGTPGSGTVRPSGPGTPPGPGSPQGNTKASRPSGVTMPKTLEQLLSGQETE